MSARGTLEALGWQPHEARTLALRFRRHSIDQLEATYPHHKDRVRLIALAKQGRAQLEELFASERANVRAGPSRGWDEWADAAGSKGVEP